MQKTHLEPSFSPENQEPEREVSEPHLDSRTRIMNLEVVVCTCAILSDGVGQELG